MKSFIKLIVVILAGVGTQFSLAQNTNHLAKFEPPPGKVIVFIGQDNASVGGADGHHDGYIEKIGVPGGVTHYVYLAEGWTNKFGYWFASGHVAGLNDETSWGAGPMCLKSYLDSPVLKPCAIHLSISLEGGTEYAVANGSCDKLIYELAQFLNQYPDRPFLLRIGYEFDGEWNGYNPEAFQIAFKRIVDKLRAAHVTNFATVMASSGSETYKIWNQYYPGDDYVDWVGYSYWGGNSGQAALEFARTHKKPAIIAESTPRGCILGTCNGPKIWDEWFTEYFNHIKNNRDVIRAVSFINCNWDSQPMWKGQNWGDTRIQENGYIKAKWLEKMSEPWLINGRNDPCNLMWNYDKAETKDAYTAASKQ